MKFIKAIIRFVLVGFFISPVTSASAGSVPASVRQCVETTAKQIQNATSADNLYRMLKPKIHTHVLGARSYGVNWKKIVALNNEQKAIFHYTNTLYRLAIKTNANAGAGGKTKHVHVTGLVKRFSVRTSYVNQSAKAWAYTVRVTISATGVAPHSIQVVVVMENGCQFADIESGGIWLSKNITSTQAMLRK